jgi:hypothetical protein
MPRLVGAILAAWVALAAPEQGQSIRPRTPTADFSLQYAPVCTDLEPPECCSQMLELAGYRAQGDQLPRLVKGLVHLTCEDTRKVVTPQACRSIAVMRGFRSHEVDAICGSALRECQEEDACNRCTEDLKKLKYRGAHHACRALTYVSHGVRGGSPR